MQTHVVGSASRFPMPYGTKLVSVPPCSSGNNHHGPCPARSDEATWASSEERFSYRCDTGSRLHQPQTRWNVCRGEESGSARMKIALGRQTTEGVGEEIVTAVSLAGELNIWIDTA